MSEKCLSPRKVVKWRAAIVLPQQHEPIHGRAIEISTSIVMLQLPIEIKSGNECRVYLDIPDPKTGKPVYIDFRVRVQATTLIGQISEFRHLMQIIQIAEGPKRFLQDLLQE